MHVYLCTNIFHLYYGMNIKVYYNFNYVIVYISSLLLTVYYHTLLINIPQAPLLDFPSFKRYKFLLQVEHIFEGNALFSIL